MQWIWLMLLMFFSDDSCYACLSSLANSWFVLHTLRQSGVSAWLCFLTGAERIRHCCKCHSTDGTSRFPLSMCVHEEVGHSLCMFYSRIYVILLQNLAKANWFTVAKNNRRFRWLRSNSNMAQNSDLERFCFMKFIYVIMCVVVCVFRVRRDRPAWSTFRPGTCSPRKSWSKKTTLYRSVSLARPMISAFSHVLNSNEWLIIIIV